MRILCLLLLLASPVASLAQDSSKPMKVKIEGDAPNHLALVEKLNLEGAGHHLKFALSDLDFDYRVVLITSHPAEKSARAGVKQDVANGTVYDSKGKMLFEFQQDGTWADPGGAASAAKEIVKEFVKLGIGGAK
jgi:hypothetical protein